MLIAEYAFEFSRCVKNVCMYICNHRTCKILNLWKKEKVGASFTPAAP